MKKLWEVVFDNFENIIFSKTLIVRKTGFYEDTGVFQYSNKSDKSEEYKIFTSLKAGYCAGLHLVDVRGSSLFAYCHQKKNLMLQ